MNDIRDRLGQIVTNQQVIAARSMPCLHVAARLGYMNRALEVTGFTPNLMGNDQMRTANDLRRHFDEVRTELHKRCTRRNDRECAGCDFDFVGFIDGVLNARRDTTHGMCLQCLQDG